MKRIKNLISVLNIFFFIGIVSSCHGQKNNAYLKLPKAKNIYTDAGIGTAIEDKKGNIWFGINGEGVFKYDGKTFTQCTKADGLPDSVVYSLLEDNAGNIWIGMQNALCMYDGKKMKQLFIAEGFTTLNMQSQIWQHKTRHTNGVWSMCLDKKGTIWLGTDNGVYTYTNNRFELLTNQYNLQNKDSLFLCGVYNIMEDSKGNMWFCNSGGDGLVKYDGKALISITGKKSAWIANMYEDNEKNIWYASLKDGICVIKNQHVFKEKYKEKESKNDSAKLWQDHKKQIWVCTSKNNWQILHSNIVEAFGEMNQLNKLKPLSPAIQDSKGNIWFASDAMGLYKFDGKQIITMCDK